MATPQDPWPKYVTLDSACEVSQKAAILLGLDNTPVAKWTHEQKILAAYLSIRIELDDSQDPYTCDTNDEDKSP